MRFDMHCHVVGETCANISQINDDVYYRLAGNLLTDAIHKLVRDDINKYGIDHGGDGKISAIEYLDFLYAKLVESREIDAIVLLAFDAVYSPRDGAFPFQPAVPKGIMDRKATEIIVSNQFLYKQVKRLNKKLKDNHIINKRFYWGASINPNRNKQNLKDEQAFIKSCDGEDQPVLVKWVPSAQHIDPAEREHEEFYKWLIAEKLPLLCHIGPEYCYSESWNFAYRPYDDYKKLDFPLEVGVTIIAPHCCAPAPTIFADPNEMKIMKDFAAYVQEKNKNNVKLWIDNSAMSIALRVKLIEQAADMFPQELMLNGTDFPVPLARAKDFAPLPDQDIKKYEKNTTQNFVSQTFWESIKAPTNPFDHDIKIKRNFGFSDSALTNPSKVLRLGK